MCSDKCQALPTFPHPSSHLSETKLISFSLILLVCLFAKIVVFFLFLLFIQIEYMYILLHFAFFIFFSRSWMSFSICSMEIFLQYLCSCILFQFEKKFKCGHLCYIQCFAIRSNGCNS